MNTEDRSALPAPRGLSRAGKWLFGLGVAGLAVLLRRPLLALAGQAAAAGLLTVLALPLCRALEGRVSRRGAALFAVLALVGGLVILIALLMPPLIAQITLIINQAPQYFRALEDIWDGIARWEWVRFLGLDENGPEQWLARGAQWIGESLPGLVSLLASWVGGLGRAFLAPALAYYFLRDREVIAYRLSLWIPLKYRRRALAALREMRREAGGYARGQMLVSLAVAALTALGLLLTGVPAWLALGVLMGLCEWIPYVGPLIGGVPILLFSLPMGLSTALWAVGITAAVQQIEGYCLSPRLMAGATGLHPAAVLLLLSFGGALGGLPGMMAAIPAFVCLRGAARVLYHTRM